MGPRGKRSSRGSVDGSSSSRRKRVGLPSQQVHHEAEAREEEEDIQELARQHDTSHWFEESRSVTVDLAALGDTVRCPICYGKIKESRVSMVCGHRYCAQCIDHCLRLEVEGRPKDVRECPVCRAHMPSRRSARQDVQFDDLMRALFGNVAEYEAQEERVMEVQRQAQASTLMKEMQRMREAMMRQKEALVAARAASCSRNQRPRAGTGDRPGPSSPQRHIRAKDKSEGSEGHPGSKGAKGAPPTRVWGRAVAALGVAAAPTKVRGRAPAPAPAVAAAPVASKASGRAARAAQPGAQPPPPLVKPTRGQAGARRLVKG